MTKRRKTKDAAWHFAAAFKPKYGARTDEAYRYLAGKESVKERFLRTQEEAAGRKRHRA